ncbi:23S rRNA (uracil(1939)-C(5))-methyltransferase RlmD [Haloimpatiens sp. FM7330]|uniref:23S rRNA (uracil(1939)-C(5))-methyltransferase RlmD n=1 Tax=Haloimpatiens sp. FM7330 TaxID=3298610 RepID=UPI00362D9DB0
MRKGKEYVIDINDTQFPGFGVGEYEGRKVLIKGAVPGQKVLARITKKRSSKIEGRVVEIVENVDYAVDPKCKHFGMCGGCSHQFLPYEKQLELKEKQVLKLFENADLSGFEYLGIEKSPEIFEYRNKMEFTFGDFEKGGELTLGMHRKGSPFSVVNVEGCQIVDEDFRMILDVVVRYFREKQMPFYRILSHEGYLRNLVIRKAKNTREILINLVTTTQVDFDLSELASILKVLDYKDTLKGIIHTCNDSLSDVVQPDKVEVLYGEEYITEDLLGLKFKIKPFSFFQTNSKGAEKLYSIVKDFLGNSNNKVVFDLYCGTGTIGQIVAGNAKKVIGIELIEEAVEAANENAKLNGLNNCEFIAGDVAKVIKEVREKPDVIILDPPRPGVHPKALDYVIKFNAPEIVYVSCNPKTLVNDLKVLTEKGYTIQKVKIMDMFAHTPHVETVVRLKRKHR